MKLFLTILYLFTLAGCSQYRFRNSDNPFAHYGISSISIPMFYNKSALPNVNWKFTKEIFSTMAKYSELKIYSGNVKKADAVLIGIIEGPESRRNTIKENSTILSDKYPTLVGQRNSFYIPKTSKVTLNLRLILIKKATDLDEQIALSELNQYLVAQQDKIIFNEIFKLKGSLSRTISGGSDTSDSANRVDDTQTKSSLEFTLDNMARAAAERFTGVVLDAF